MRSIYGDIIKIDTNFSKFDFENFKSYADLTLIHNYDRIQIDELAKKQVDCHENVPLQMGVLIKLCVMLSCYISELSLIPENAIEMCNNNTFLSLIYTIFSARIFLFSSKRREPRLKDAFFLKHLDFICEYLSETFLSMSQHLVISSIQKVISFNLFSAIMPIVCTSNLSVTTMRLNQKNILNSFSNLSNNPENAKSLAIFQMDCFPLNILKSFKEYSAEGNFAALNLLANLGRVNNLWRTIIVKDFELYNLLIKLIENQINLNPDEKICGPNELASELRQAYFEKLAILIKIYAESESFKEQLKQHLPKFKILSETRYFYNKVRNEYESMNSVISAPAKEFEFITPYNLWVYKYNYIN